MKIFAFIKLLNKKINKYDKLTSNPFGTPQPITLVWVENNDKSQ
jgi:hypothetical protein